MSVQDENYTRLSLKGKDFKDKVNFWIPTFKSKFQKSKDSSYLIGSTVKEANTRMFDWNG